MLPRGAASRCVTRGLDLLALRVVLGPLSTPGGPAAVLSGLSPPCALETGGYLLTHCLPLLLSHDKTLRFGAGEAVPLLSLQTGPVGGALPS